MGRVPMEKRTGGNEPKGKYPKGKETEWEDPKEKEAKGNDRKGKIEPYKEREQGEVAIIHYTSYSIGAQQWGPTNRINGRQYQEYRNSRYDWIWIGGEWRETRCPTEEEIDEIEGKTKKVGFREHKTRRMWKC